MTHKPGTHFFSPVPNRAYFDDRLDKIHMKVFGVIAMHDRMGRNGQRCTLSVRRIGERLGIDFSYVAKAIRDLAEFGYVERLAHPTHSQRQQLAVAYDDAADLAVLSGNRGVGVPRLAKPNPPDRGVGAPRLDTRDRGVGAPHIIDTAEADKRYPAEAAPNGGSKKNSAEATPEPQDGSGAYEVKASPASRRVSIPEMQDGELLRRLEQSFKDGCVFTDEQLAAVHERLDTILEKHETHDGGIGGWALRLCHEVEVRMSEDASLKYIFDRTELAERMAR